MTVEDRHPATRGPSRSLPQRVSPCNHSSSVRCAVCFPGEYFGRFPIRYVRPAELIKTHAASIKRFYKWLLSQGLVDKEDYAGFCRDISDSNIRRWKKDFEQYYDLTKSDPFFEDF